MATDSANPEPQPSAAASEWSVDTPAHADHDTPQKRLGDMSISNDALADAEKAVEADAPGELGEKQYLVEFDGPGDLSNPKNWTQKKRWAVTVSMALLVFTVTFASSIFSVNISVVQEKFNVTKVTATLGVALFVLVSNHVLALDAQKADVICIGFCIWTNRIRTYVRGPWSTHSSIRGIHSLRPIPNTGCRCAKHGHYMRRSLSRGVLCRSAALSCRWRAC